PIKQAHREVYALTGEESRAKTRSSRFAGHILRQSQFRALCRERRWAYDLRGAWDPSDDPRRAVPHHDLAIRLEIDIDEDETGGPDALGVYTHVLTGQITFRNGKGRLMNLADVPPMVFSELLRDVDLFVSVASVANDPGLTNGGPDG